LIGVENEFINSKLDGIDQGKDKAAMLLGFRISETQQHCSFIFTLINTIKF
jgi:hypothetical protein